MRILRVSLTYPRENMPGVGLPCYYHSNYSKHDNLIITLKMDGTMIPSKENVKIREIAVDNPALGDFEIGFLKKIGRYIMKLYYQLVFLLKSINFIKEFKPEVVHVYSPIPILFGLYCKLKFGSRFILSLHGTDVERVVRSSLLQLILKLPDRVVCVGQSMQERLSGIKLKNSIEYMGNGYEKEVFYNNKKIREKQIITVGNLRWQKGHKYLIEAFNKLHFLYPDYKLILIGNGPDYDILYKRVVSLGLGKHVEFRGICSRKNIAYELNKSKLFVLSSILEGFPKVIIESMGTGTPIVSTDVGNVKKVVEDSGYIVPAKDGEKLFEAMVKMIENPNWFELSEKAEKLAQQYTWESVVNRLEKIYSN